jgi:hypothetical protein
MRSRIVLESIRLFKCVKRLRDKGGLALVATLLVLAMMGVIVASAVRAVMSSTRAAGLEYHEARAFYAAEAGGEAALAQLKIALQDGYLSDEELADITPPTLEDFSYDSFSIERQGEAIVEQITDGPYTGLYALTQNVDVFSLAEDRNGTVSGVILRAKAQAIPIFQFGVFFEEDLEATNGPPMEFIGRVHSNGNIFLSSNNAWYREMITTPNKVFHDRKDFHNVFNGVFINDAGGNEVMLDFDSRTHAGPEAFKAQSCAQLDCRLQTDAFDVDSLKLPLPEGVPPYELVRVREADDGDSEQEVKFAWNADTYVTVDFTNMRTKGEVCGGGGSNYEPDATTGSLQMTALDPVLPGETVRFQILAVDCDGFDGDVTVYADGSAIVNTSLDDICTFVITIPSLTDELAIQVVEDGGGVSGTAYWYGLQSLADDSNAPYPDIAVERSGGREVPGPDDLCRIFPFQWSSFYDGRERELKDVMNIDVAQLAAWVGGSGARMVELAYVEFIGPADIGSYPSGTRDMMIDATLDPAVRLINATTLPNRMTVAGEWPIYVRGDYNRINKQPAAVVGDGITILSSVWLDSQNRPDATVFNGCIGLVGLGNPCPGYENWRDFIWSRRNSGETTVNAAVLAGHWPTPCDHEEAGCAADGTNAFYQDWYGGGIENFPRFLERWRDAGGNPVVFHYLGALISPFTSQKTTGTWNGTYYVPPQRDWAFDTDFRDPRLLPPGTPNVGNVIRTAMREAF